MRAITQNVDNALNQDQESAVLQSADLKAIRSLLENIAASTRPVNDQELGQTLLERARREMVDATETVMALTEMRAGFPDAKTCGVLFPDVIHRETLSRAVASYQLKAATYVEMQRSIEGDDGFGDDGDEGMPF